MHGSKEWFEAIKVQYLTSWFSGCDIKHVKNLWDKLECQLRNRAECPISPIELLMEKI